MKTYIVYQQIGGVVERVFTLTADTAVDALRIAKQKGFWAPIIGDAK